MTDIIIYCSITSYYYAHIQKIKDLYVIIDVPTERPTHLFNIQT